MSAFTRLLPVLAEAAHPVYRPDAPGSRATSCLVGPTELLVKKAASGWSPERTPVGPRPRSSPRALRSSPTMPFNVSLRRPYPPARRAGSSARPVTSVTARSTTCRESAPPAAQGRHCHLMPAQSVTGSAQRGAGQLMLIRHPPSGPGGRTSNPLAVSPPATRRVSSPGCGRTARSAAEPQATITARHPFRSSRPPRRRPDEAGTTAVPVGFSYLQPCTLQNGSDNGCPDKAK
jgi:hypothetical protein